MDKILNAKHWQVFIFLIIALFINSFEIESNTTLTVALSITGMILYMIYPFLIGIGLQDYLPQKIKLNENPFIINFSIWLVAYIGMMIISDGEGMEFEGLIALPFFYVAYAFIHTLAFPVKTLKTIELGRKAKFGDYFGDFILMILFPIGIWFLQPRIKKAIEINKNRTANKVYM